MENSCDLKDCIELAKIAEHADRFKDMADCMKRFIQGIDGNKKLEEEQRNLFSVAYKNLVGAKRTSWRILSSVEQKADTDGSKAKNKAALQEYKAKVEAELKETCMEVIGLLSDLIQGAAEPESKVFYHKMKGDYYRYMCEVENAEECVKKVKCDSEEAYKAAVQEAEKLTPTNPIRLGLALNYSVFMYEIMAEPQNACQHAKKAFDDAIQELDKLEEKEYKDSTLIMQLLRDNLTLWNNDGEGAALEEQGQVEDN